jgi:hypothetical protein
MVHRGDGSRYHLRFSNALISFDIETFCLLLGNSPVALNPLSQMTPQVGVPIASFPSRSSVTLTIKVAVGVHCPLRGRALAGHKIVSIIVYFVIHFLLLSAILHQCCRL